MVVRKETKDKKYANSEARLRIVPTPLDLKGITDARFETSKNSIDLVCRRDTSKE